MVPLRFQLHHHQEATMAEGPPYKSAHDVPRGTPTPTQDELNKIALGEQVELAPDGTPPDQNTTMPYDPKGTSKAQEKAPAHHTSSMHAQAQHESHPTGARSKA
jgi:hypothetical protein